MSVSENKAVDEGRDAADTAAATARVTAAVLDEKLADAQTPGFWTEFAPDEAELAGAFEEAALSESEAAASDIDLPARDDDEDKAKERGS